jgi:N-acetylmuramoyl-L-alanine amidase
MSLLTAVSLPAQKKTDVLLKFSKQGGLLRIVCEAEEAFIAKTKATAAFPQIKIEFPEPFNLTAPKDLPFELNLSEKSAVVTLKEKGEIKSFRLSNPARLVFDIQKKEKSQEKQGQEKQSTQILSKAFVIDAGHGGYDFGITAGNANEKDVCLNLAKELATALSKKGKKVFLVRKVDQYVSLADRISFVNQKTPDMFISFHVSSTKNFVIYNTKPEEQASNEMTDSYSLSARQKKHILKSKALSDSLVKALKDEFNGEVIHREMPLPILNSAGASAVLVEIPSLKYMMYDQQMIAKVTNAIINGIAAYGQ